MRDVAHFGFHFLPRFSVIGFGPGLMKQKQSNKKTLKGGKNWTKKLGLPTGNDGKSAVTTDTFLIAILNLISGLSAPEKVDQFIVSVDATIAVKLIHVFMIRKSPAVPQTSTVSL
jgi:hypothetical protein